MDEKGQNDLSYLVIKKFEDFQGRNLVRIDLKNIPNYLSVLASAGERSLSSTQMNDHDTQSEFRNKRNVIILSDAGACFSDALFFLFQKKREVPRPNSNPACCSIM